MDAEWLMAVAIDLGPQVDEAAYDRWYDERHLPAIIGCPGIESGRRYTQFGAAATDPRRDLTLYEISGPEALESPEFAQRRGFEEFAGSLLWTNRIYRRRTQR